MREDLPVERVYFVTLLKIACLSLTLCYNVFVCVQVEALQGHRVIDVACGSGDAQTLCLTDDDMVWSWGDGDYGKLGRGGSDGCKVPMKVRPLYIDRKIFYECFLYDL